MSDHRPRDPAKLNREKRLEAQLKANLRRRKEQARAREAGPPVRPEPAAEEYEPSTPPDKTL